MSKSATIKADFLEAGSGPLVMLVHSSVCGARHSLLADKSFHVFPEGAPGDFPVLLLSFVAVQSWTMQ